MRSVRPSLQHVFLGSEVGHRGVWAGRDSGGPIRTLHVDTLLIFWALEQEVVGSPSLGVLKKHGDVALGDMGPQESCTCSCADGEALVTVVVPKAKRRSYDVKLNCRVVSYPKKFDG